MMKNFILLMLMPLVVFADFGSETEVKIDTIENNTASDITLKPNNSVIIDNLTGNFVLQSSATKEIEESVVTNTELGYVSGVTSSIQTQIDGKEPLLPLNTDGDLLYWNSGMSRLGIGTTDQYLKVSALGFPEWADFPTISPLTTKGDLYTFDTDNQRLAVGSDNQILSANSATATGLEWIDPPPTDPLTTKGDLFTFDTDAQRLSVGTDSQILSANSATSTGLEWIDPPATSPLTTKGDIYTYDTDNQRIAVGTNGQLLSANSATATGLEWIDAPTTSPTTTEGDLIVRGASEDERLAIGTNGQLLTSNGTTASWQDAPVSTTLTTKGDIQTYDTANQRLPVGADGTFLVADSTESTGLKWTDTLSGTLNPVSDYEDFTPVYQTGGNNFTATKSRWKRIGDEILLEFEGQYSGASTDVTLSVRFPNNLFATETKVRYTSGHAEYFSASGNDHYFLPTDLRADGTSSYWQFLLSGTNPALPARANGTKISGYVRAKIQGWTSGTDAVVTSKELARVKAFGSISRNIPNGNTSRYIFENEVKDNLGIYNASNGLITCPEAGSEFSIDAGIYVENIDRASGSVLLFSLRDVTNGNTYELNRMRSFEGTGLTSHTITGSIKFTCINQGDVWDILPVCNNADTSTCTTRAATGSEYNYIAINEEPKSVVITGVVDPIICQTKFLSSDLSVNTADIADLRFNNLTIGRAYSVTITPLFQMSVTDTSINLSAFNNGALITRGASGYRASSGNKESKYSAIGYFEAAATTTTFDLASVASGNILRGNGAATETSATLCEYPTGADFNSNKFD